MALKLEKLTCFGKEIEYNPYFFTHLLPDEDDFKVVQNYETIYRGTKEECFELVEELNSRNKDFENERLPGLVREVMRANPTESKIGWIKIIRDRARDEHEISVSLYQVKCLIEDEIEQDQIVE